MGVLDHRPVSIASAVAPLGCGAGGAGGYIVARTRAVHDQWQGEPSLGVDVDRGEPSADSDVAGASPVPAACGMELG